MGTTEPRPASAQRKVVALVGNPNCGKTTLFNALTGSHYKVANYPGVTVDKKEGGLPLPSGVSSTLLDLPGTYSLQGMSDDERVTTNVIEGKLLPSGKPDLLVVVLDATNLERNLFLVSELLDEKLPLLIAINMIDDAESAGIKIYSDLLARLLDTPVVTISARQGRGIPLLVQEIDNALSRQSISTKMQSWVPKNHPISSQLALPSPSAETITTIGALRYAWSKEIVLRTTQNISPKRTGKLESLDRILTSRVFGVPILLCIFGLLFQSIFLWAQAPMAVISAGVDAMAHAARAIVPEGMLADLLSDGIISGVGNVIIFIPQIALLFLFLGILEDCGYLSRAAFLLDTIMRKFGLQGRAFIPLLSSFACAVPGILSTRSIPSFADRLTTIMIAPLMSCSARLPVYAVLIAAFIPSLPIFGIFGLQGLVLLAMYLLGIISACAVALVFKQTLRSRADSFYVMEMPPLRMPILKVVLRGVYDAITSFLRNAATIILACSIVIWFLASYPKPAPDYQGNPVEVSFAGRMGKLIEPVITPLGFNWEIGVAIISSFPAREVFVTGLSTVYNVHDDEDTHTGIIADLQHRHAQGTFSTLTALSLMVFYVFACQCMSTLAVVRRETGSWRWTLGMFGYMTALAYMGALLTFQVGGMFFR